MKTRAAVAWAANKPLTIETIEIGGPKPGEVLVENMATGVCHTDAYTLSGLDSEGKFPAVLGHEGAGIVREVGAGVTSVAPVASRRTVSTSTSGRNGSIRSSAKAKALPRLA